MKAFTASIAASLWSSAFSKIARDRFPASIQLGDIGGGHSNRAIRMGVIANVAKLTMQDVRQSQELQSLLYKSTCNHLNAAHDLITTLTKKSAEQKVAAFLVKLAGQADETNEAEVALPMSRQDIADYLGMSIETVSRRLTAFKEAGLLSLPNRRQANIKSVSRLKALAGALQ